MTGRRNTKVANKLRRKAASASSSNNNNSSSNGNGCGSGSGNANHVADHNARWLGVGTGTSAPFDYDKCHNTSSPSCNDLRDIVHNIFPEFVSSNSNASSNALNANATANASEQEKNGEESINHPDKAEKAMPSPSLFSLVVRKYLLEDRKKRLGGNLSRISNANGTESKSAITSTSSTTSALQLGGVSATTNTGKKKRKKKKKKSKTSQAQVQVQVDQSEGQRQNQNQNQALDQQQTKTAEQTSTSAQVQDSAKQSESALRVPSSTNTINNESSSSSKDSTVKNTRTKSNPKLDAMLDQVLIQPNGTGIKLPENRDLISLLQYISNKCHPCPLPQDQSQAQMESKTQPSKSAKSKHSRRGSNSNSNASSLNNDNTPMEMPTISLQKIKQIVNQITCKACETSCIKYLEHLSYRSSPRSSPTNQNHANGNGYTRNSNMHTCDGGFGPHGRISSALDVGFGGYEEDSSSTFTNLNGSASADVNGYHNSNNGNGIILNPDDCFEVISSFPLDKNSISVSKDSPQFCGIGKKFPIKPDEHAFDYDLMEEGGYSNSESGIGNGNDCDVSSANCTITTEESSAFKGSGMRMDLIQDRETLIKYFRLRLDGESTFTVDNFDCLLKDIIFPCGMKEEAAMTEEEIKKISANTEKLSSYLSDEIRKNLPQTLSEMQKALDDAEEYLKSPGQFNVKAVKSLRSCNQLQIKYMQSCRGFLAELERRTLHMQNSKHEHQKWVNNLMNRLWDSYMDCSKSLVEPSLRCMWKSIQAECKRTGSVPQHFNSPPLRENLKKMLEKRLLILANLQETFELELLSCPEDGIINVPVFRRLAAFGEYFASKDNFESDSLKEILEELDDMMVLRNETICSTIYQTDVKTILCIQSDRCTQLYQKISDVLEQVNDLIGTIGMDQRDKFTWQANMIMIEENMMSYEENRAEEAEPSLNHDLNEVLNLCEFAKNTLYQYRFYSAIKAKKTMSKFNEMKEIPTQVMKICQGEFASFKCGGGGGLRRVAGILSVYLYIWLQERCMEWHADLTHQELVNSEEELLQETKLSAANEQKKKAKKKKKRKGQTKKIQSTEDEPKPHCESIEKSSIARDTMEKRQVSPSAVINFPKPCASQSDAQVNIEDTSAGIPPQSIATLLTEDPSLDLANDMPKESVSIQEENFQEEYIQVCVTDKGEKISVEDFLCNRYFDALKASNVQHYY